MFKNRFLKNESSLTKTNPSVSFIREKYLNIEELHDEIPNFVPLS